MWLHFREIAGWLLVLGSVYLMTYAIEYLENSETPQVGEASGVIIISLALMRAGILLIRISTAARIVLAEIAHDKTIDLDA